MSLPELRGMPELMAELSDPSTTVERAESLMAALDGLEAPALPTVFRWLHDAPDEDAIHAATRLLVRWRESEAAKALPKALRALVREPEAGDLNKIAAAGVLAVLGEPLHDADLARFLRDPSAVMRASLRRLVDPAMGRLTIANTLDALAARPVDAVLPLIDDLTGLDDPNAARVLLPLSHHADPDLAVSAIAALDQLEAWRAASALAPVATAHPAPGVRAQAELTAGRLEAARPAGAAPPPPVNGIRVRRVALPQERRVLLLSAPSPRVEGERELLTLHVDPAIGVVESAVLERVGPEDMRAIEQRLGEAGAEIGTMPDEEARQLLEQATARTVDGASKDASLGWLTWRELLAPLA